MGWGDFTVRTNWPVFLRCWTLFTNYFENVHELTAGLEIDGKIGKFIFFNEFILLEQSFTDVNVFTGKKVITAGFDLQGQNLT